MKWIAGVVLGVVLAGCSLTREVPPVQHFHLDNGITIAPAAQACERVLRIALIQAPQQLRGTAIYYAGSDQKLYRYTRARWEQSVVEQLQQRIEKSVIEHALFTGVVPYKSLAKNDWLLEIRIEKMLQTIGKEGQSHTDLMIYGVLVDQYSRHILGQKTFRYRHADVAPDIQSVVDVWSEDIGTFTAELNAWLEAQCRTQPKVDRSDVNL